MKTTVEIPDALFAEAKKLARARSVPFREIVAEGLLLAVDRTRREVPFVLSDGSVKGRGPAPKPEWNELRDLIYEGRGA